MTAAARRRTRRAVKPEAAVLRAVLDGLAAYRVPAFRLNSGARLMSGDGETRRFVRFGFPGCPDVMAFFPSGLGFIEVKGPRGVLSAEQVAFRDLCRERGVVHVVAYSFDDVMPWVRAKGAA